MKTGKTYVMLIMISLSFAHYIVYAGEIEKVKDSTQLGLQEQQGKKSTNDFNVDIVGGFGLPDLLHGGLRMHFGNSYRLGFTIGSLPVTENLKGEDEKLIAFSFDNFIMLKRAGVIPRSPWYSRISINYLRWETNKKISRESFLNLSFGKEVYIFKHFGFDFDLGFNIPISQTIEWKEPEPNTWIDIDIDPPVYPSFRFGFYYRF